MQSPLAEGIGADDGDGSERPSLKIDTAHVEQIRQRSLQSISEAARRRRSQSLQRRAPDPLADMFDHITVYNSRHGGIDGNDGDSSGHTDASAVSQASAFQRLLLAGPSFEDDELVMQHGETASWVG